MAIENQTDNALVIKVAKYLQNHDALHPYNDDDDCIEMAEAIIVLILETEGH